MDWFLYDNGLRYERVNFIHPYSYFKMEGLHLLKDLLRDNDFMRKVDLKYAYCCFPLDRNHQKKI